MASPEFYNELANDLEKIIKKIKEAHSGTTGFEEMCIRGLMLELSPFWMRIVALTEASLKSNP